MSWDINHVVVIGRLTRDPELSYTQSGSAVCRFSIAVNRSSGSGGEGQEDTTSFFNVVAWNKTAELCKEYLSKGKQVGIDGRLQQRRWSGTDGAKRSSVEIVANNVQFFGPPTSRTQDRQYQPSEKSLPPREGSGREYTPKEYAPREREQQPDGRPPGGDQSAVEKGVEEQEHDPFLSELDDDEIPF